MRTSGEAAMRLALAVNPQGPRESAGEWYRRVARERVRAVPLIID
ncbi:hypothetical protein [Collinsella vaginalis]|nr:hypothetical protein [Collinsella vaginalis]